MGYAGSEFPKCTSPLNIDAMKEKELMTFFQHRMHLGTFVGRGTKARNLVAVFMAVGFLQAQSSGVQPLGNSAKEFDAASIRPHSFSEGRGPSDVRSITRDAQMVSLQAITVLGMILFAYDTTANKVQGLPPWALEDTYDCRATTSTPATLSEQQEMMRRLLIDRFGLLIHRANKEGKIYTLELIPQTASRLSPVSSSEKQASGQFRSIPVVHSDGTTFNIDYSGANVE